eukprot:333963-Pyramimonas_sp.AAC.1
MGTLEARARTHRPRGCRLIGLRNFDEMEYGGGLSPEMLFSPSHRTQSPLKFPCATNIEGFVV